jgi:tRNA(fMet)-specific endonuclease VapC
VVLKIDEDIYEMFGALSADLRSQREPVGDFDDLIACIAMANGSAIVTRDEHFKYIPGLKVISH